MPATVTEEDKQGFQKPDTSMSCCRVNQLNSGKSFHASFKPFIDQAGVDKLLSDARFPLTDSDRAFMKADLEFFLQELVI